MFALQLFTRQLKGLVWPQYVWVAVPLEQVFLTLSSMRENVVLIMYKSPTLDYSNTTCAENVSSTISYAYNQMKID